MTPNNPSRTPNRAVLMFAGVAVLLLCGLWLLNKRTSEDGGVAGDPATASAEAGSSDGVPGRFQILSETLTSTGRVYRTTKDGITKTGIVPEHWAFTPEQVEDMLFPDPGGDAPQARPSRVELNRELVFYGIALDEKSNAVINASVEANVGISSPTAPQRRDIVRQTTGADGRFELRIPWGQQMMLTVKGSTNDYINPEPQWFQYGPVGNKPIHRPDWANPVVFLFHRRTAEEPLFGFSKGYFIPNDGTPVRVDLTTGEIVPVGGDLIVTLHAMEPYTNMKPFPWKVGLEVVDGGLQKTGGLGTRMEHLHEAPSDGYESGFLIEYGPDTPNYLRQHGSWYYVRSRNGQHHAKLYFSCSPIWDERGIAFGLRAVVNTNSSRYLHTEP